MSDLAAPTPTSVFHSHVGVVRTVNEDAFLDAPEAGIWLVADGMGGEAQGERASRAVVDGLAGLAATTSLDVRVQQAVDVLQRINAELQQAVAETVDARMIATTVACLIGFEDSRCVCLWAGDSRVYRWRRGRLERLTRDHSQVQDLIDDQVIDAEAARDHRLKHVITRAVGALPDLELEQREDLAEPGDLYLLCSDGLHGLVTDAELERMLGAAGPDELTRALVHLAVSRGAPDNVTVGIVQP